MTGRKSRILLTTGQSGRETSDPKPHASPRVTSHCSEFSFHSGWRTTSSKKLAKGWCMAPRATRTTRSNHHCLATLRMSLAHVALLMARISGLSKLVF
jgi:hypothetical protein